MDSKKATKTYSIILMATLLSKVLGFLREILLSYFYGDSIEASAFMAASQVPLTLFDITMGTAIASVFIPVLNDYLAKNDEKKAWRFVSNFLTIILIISAVLVTFGMIFPDVAIKLVGSGFNDKTLELASSLLRNMLPMIFFAALSYILIGVLQSRQQFIVPALVSVVSNLVLIIYFLFLNKNGGINGLSIALLVGWIMQFLFLVPSVKKTGLKYKPIVDFKDEGIRTSLVLAIPVLISSWAQPINSIIGTNFGSYIDGGEGVTTLRYAYTIYFVVAGVFSFALTNMMFPELSRQFSKGNYKKAGELGNSMLSTISAIILPVMFLFIALSKPLILAVYNYGASASGDVIKRVPVLMMYSIGMLALSWQEILNKFFYSMKKSYIPMIVAIIGIVINLVCAFTLKDILGAPGIALATAVSGTIMALVLFIYAKVKIPEICDKKMILSILKSFISAAVSGFLAYLLGEYLLTVLSNDFIGWALSLVVSGIVGVIIYIGGLILLRSDKIDEIKNMIKSKRK